MKIFSQNSSHFFFVAACLPLTMNSIFRGFTFPKSLKLLSIVKRYLPWGKSSGSSKFIRLHDPLVVCSLMDFYFWEGDYLKMLILNSPSFLAYFLPPFFLGSSSSTFLCSSLIF
jgi:hypothetical protein